MKKLKAFTLVELVVVMVIIGLLFVFLIPKINFATNLAKESGVKNTLHSYQIAITSAMNENAGLDSLDAGKTPVSVINEYLDPALKISDAGVISYLDPWNEPYVYQYADNTVRIYSNGSSASATADSDIAYADGTQISLVVKFAEGKVLSGTTGLSKNTSDGLTTAEVESAIAELDGSEDSQVYPEMIVGYNRDTGAMHFELKVSDAYDLESTPYFSTIQISHDDDWLYARPTGRTVRVSTVNHGDVQYYTFDASVDSGDGTLTLLENNEYSTTMWFYSDEEATGNELENMYSPTFTYYANTEDYFVEHEPIGPHEAEIITWNKDDNIVTLEFAKDSYDFELTPYFIGLQIQAGSDNYGILKVSDEPMTTTVHNGVEYYVAIGSVVEGAMGGGGSPSALNLEDGVVYSSTLWVNGSSDESGEEGMYSPNFTYHE